MKHTLGVIAVVFCVMVVLTGLGMVLWSHNPNHHLEATGLFIVIVGCVMGVTSAVAANL